MAGVSVRLGVTVDNGKVVKEAVGSEGCVGVMVIKGLAEAVVGERSVVFSNCGGLQADNGNATKRKKNMRILIL